MTSSVKIRQIFLCREMLSGPFFQLWHLASWQLLKELFRDEIFGVCLTSNPSAGIRRVKPRQTRKHRHIEFCCSDYPLLKLPAFLNPRTTLIELKVGIKIEFSFSLYFYIIFLYLVIFVHRFFLLNLRWDYEVMN